MHFGNRNKNCTSLKKECTSCFLYVIYILKITCKAVKINIDSHDKFFLPRFSATATSFRSFLSPPNDFHKWATWKVFDMEMSLSEQNWIIYYYTLKHIIHLFSQDCLRYRQKHTQEKIYGDIKKNVSEHSFDVC